MRFAPFSEVHYVVSGPYANFRDPIAKVEGHTYPCITGSAARGVAENIYYHPEFYYTVKSIELLKPIQSGFILGLNEPDFSARGNANVLRNLIVLQDVSYHVTLEIHPRPGYEQGARGNTGKWKAIFYDRLERGKCYHQPFLGVIEFAASVVPYDPKTHKPHSTNYYIGEMLLDINYESKPQPVFMRDATIRKGILYDGEKTIGEVYAEKMCRTALYDYNTSRDVVEGVKEELDA